MSQGSSYVHPPRDPIVSIPYPVQSQISAIVIHRSGCGCIVVVIWVHSFINLSHSTGQFYSSTYDEHKTQNLTWCSTNAEELSKCQNFTMALERDRGLFEDDFFNVVCKQAFNSEECVQWIDRGDADATTLDAGEVFNAGRFHSLVPLIQEAFEGGFKNYYAVAVLKKDSLTDLNSLYQLRGKKACFAGVGSQAGWTIPIHMVSRR